MSKNSIWPIDRTLTYATTPGQSGTGNNANEGVLHISQSCWTGTSPSDCLMSYLGHSLPGGLPLCRVEVGIFYTEPIMVGHHHHHVMPPARISLTLSRRFSLSFIGSGRSSGLHPVSSHSCCRYVLAGHPALARPYAGVHRSTSLMSLSLLLQQCPACLVRLTWIVFVMRGRWPYSWCSVVCCRQDLFNIARNILV